MSSILPYFVGCVCLTEFFPELERSCQHMQILTSYVTSALHTTTYMATPAFQNNGIIGCNVSCPHPLERASQLVFVGAHGEQGEQNASVCLLLDCICALQTPTELNLHLLLIRGERKTG